MKLGFLQVYNEVNWVGYAVDQAMAMCDKLLITEGSQFVDFLDIPERSTERKDMVELLIQKYKEIRASRSCYKLDKIEGFFYILYK